MDESQDAIDRLGVEWELVGIWLLDLEGGFIPGCTRPNSARKARKFNLRTFFHWLLRANPCQ